MLLGLAVLELEVKAVLELGGEGGVRVGSAGGEEGATLVLLVTRPSSVVSSSSCTTWGVFLFGFLKISFFSLRDG